MKQIVTKEQTETITIPMDKLNKHDTFVPVVINDNIMQIKRGVPVKVSRTVANILREAGYIA